MGAREPMGRSRAADLGLGPLLGGRPARCRRRPDHTSRRRVVAGERSLPPALTDRRQCPGRIFGRATRNAAVGKEDQRLTGKSTWSMTWMTPLLALRLAATIDGSVVSLPSMMSRSPS